MSYYKDPYPEDISNMVHPDIHQAALDRIAALEEQLVWGFHMEEWPEYCQGKAGEHEVTELVTAEDCNGLIKMLKDQKSAIDAAVKAERERAAKIADVRADKWGGKDPITRDICRRIAAAIRAGGEG